MMEWNMKSFWKLFDVIHLFHYPTKVKCAFGFLLKVFFFCKNIFASKGEGLSIECENAFTKVVLCVICKCLQVLWKLEFWWWFIAFYKPMHFGFLFNENYKLDGDL